MSFPSVLVAFPRAAWISPNVRACRSTAYLTIRWVWCAPFASTRTDQAGPLPSGVRVRRAKEITRPHVHLSRTGRGARTVDSHVADRCSFLTRPPYPRQDAVFTQALLKRQRSFDDHHALPADFHRLDRLSIGFDLD